MNRRAEADWRPLILLAALLVAGVAFSIWQTRGQALYADEFGRFTGYWDADVEFFLRGFSGHLITLHTLLYAASFEVFGGGAYLPFRLLEGLLLAACALLFFFLARPRAGGWPAVGGAFVLLFLGSAHEVIATPYGNVILLPMALGAAALLVLDRLRERGDLAACLLLCAAVASLDVGLVFIPAVAILIALQSERVLTRRQWVPIVPTVLYAVWFVWTRATGGFEIDEPLRLENLVDRVPGALVDLPAAALSAVSGLFGEASIESVEGYALWPGRILLVLFVVFLIWRWRRPPRLDRWILVPLAAALTFWVLVAMTLSDVRPLAASRYFFPGAFFLLLILAAAINGLQAPRWAVPAGAVVLVAAAVPNVLNYADQADSLRELARTNTVSRAASELIYTETGELPSDVTARDYINAVQRFGSPAGGPAGVLEGDATERAFLDASLLGAGLLEVSKRSVPRGACAPPQGQELTVPDRGVRLLDVPLGSLRARRFASGFGPGSKLLAGGNMLVRPAGPLLVRPWVLRLPAGVRVCRLP